MWSLLGSHLIQMVRATFFYGQLLTKLNRTYLVLIPNIQFPNLPQRFRPVGLRNVLYKVISNLLVLIIKPFISKLISLFQGGFVSGRQITDSILAAHEAFHTIRKTKCQIDFEKAYAQVS